MCHLESFIFSRSERGDFLDPLHRLLPVDLMEYLLAGYYNAVYSGGESTSPAIIVSLPFTDSRTGRLSSLLAFPLHILTSIPLKRTFLWLSPFHIPASSHAVHFCHCFNFTLHCSGISSSSQTLWWPHYNFHLWIFHPSITLFQQCQCLWTKDQPSLNCVNSWFSALLVVQFPLSFLSLLPVGLFPAPGYHCDTFTKKAPKAGYWKLPCCDLSFYWCLNTTTAI